MTPEQIILAVVRHEIDAAGMERAAEQLPPEQLKYLDWGLDLVARVLEHFFPPRDSRLEKIS